MTEEQVNDANIELMRRNIRSERKKGRGGEYALERGRSHEILAGL